MNYNKGIKFKLIETPHALIVGHEGVNVKGGQPLMMTDDTVQLATYLNRYLWGRSNGESLDKALAALRELHAMVNGECPSLLDDDSGGSGRLGIEIEDILAKHKEPR